VLVTWRYRKRRSLIQSFDPRAWIVFYLCFMGVVISFWDVRVLAVFFVVALTVVFSSGIGWREMRRAWLFIGGFILYFSLFTFLTGRGGVEFYTEEHVIRNLQAPFSIFGWQPIVHVTVERAFYALSMLVRVFSLASMTILIPYSFNPGVWREPGAGLLDDRCDGPDHAIVLTCPDLGDDGAVRLGLRLAAAGCSGRCGWPADRARPSSDRRSEDIIDAMDLAPSRPARTGLRSLPVADRA
jgi:energy-coupling factor transport system permease protein